MAGNGRDDPIPVAKLKAAQANAEDLAASLVPETLDQCSAPVPDLEDGLTQDEKFLAISRLEVSGRTRSSEGTQQQSLQPKSGAALKLNYGWVCQCGFYPEDLSKKNQDNLLVAAHLGSKFPDMSLFGVFDGHGKFGTECSTFAVDKFSKYMLGHKNFRSNPEQAYTETMEKVNKDMHKQKKKRRNPAFFDDTLAGTTSICVLFVGDEIVVANVGDSRAVIAMEAQGRLIAENLSADQTPYRKDERERCKKAGAVVMTMDQLEGYRIYDPDVDTWGDEEDDGGDPPRLWLPNKGCPGVAFTRSLGDEMAETIGCIPTPELLRRKVLPTDRFIVIASDGVFEFLSSQTVVDMVAKFTDPYEAARALVAEAYKLWLHYEVRTDDITAIVIFIDHPEAAAFSANQLLTMQSGSTTNMLVNPNQIESRPVRREMSRRKRDVIEATMIQEQEDEEDDKEAEQEEIEQKEKSEDEIKAIRLAISTNFLFQHLTPAQLDQVISKFQRVDVKKDQVVIKQGEIGTKFYVVGTGEYDCFLDQEDGTMKKVHQYKAVEGKVGNPSFGELALMYSKPRAASVIATQDGVLWALGRKTFRRVLIKRPNREVINALRKVKILSSLAKSQLQRLADTVSELQYNDGDVIIRQGDVGDTMYLVKDGQVRCLIDQNTPGKVRENINESGDEFVDCKEVLRVSAGGYFGEKALLQSEPRAAHVVAVGNTTCFYINRKMFEEVLGPLADIIQKHAKQREVTASAEKHMKEQADAFGLTHVSLDQISPICTVSSGETSKIRVVTIKGNRDSSFTLKSFNRKLVEEKKSEGVVDRDRNLLPLAGINDSNEDSNCSNFVFPILKTFIGNENLHVAMGGIACGPLSDFMAEPFNNNVAQFVAANIVLLIESFHKRNILCRAINPYLLMLDNKGYIRLADLGLGRYLEDKSVRAMTMCGDTGYLAPEQVMNRGYSTEVDFWALGILTFEMLTGSIPFTPQDMFTQITNFNPDEMKFGDNISEPAKDLIRKLLQPDARNRLCKIEQIKQHEFFQGFNWSELKVQKLGSPLEQPAKQAVEEILANPTPREDIIDYGQLNSTDKAVQDKWYKDF